MRRKKILALILLILGITVILVYVAYSTFFKKTNRYSFCELGDLVGDDVESVYLDGYRLDYHSDSIDPDKVLDYGKKCIQEGILTQYEMDCCMREKMF